MDKRLEGVLRDSVECRCRPNLDDIDSQNILFAIEDLKTKVAELEKDAARYRYLRSRDSRVDVCDQCGYDGLHLRTEHLLDCHIDDAMKESK